MIPAGCVLALGAGVLVYELQQPSEVTYRLDDWGRVGVDGQPRTRHLTEGSAAIKPEVRPTPIAPIALTNGAQTRRVRVACRYFALEQISLVADNSIPIAGEHTAHVLTVLRGETTVATAAGQQHLQLGQTAVLPAVASPGELTATIPSVVLHAWVPDLVNDVISPLRRVGASDTQIASLSGPLPDLADALASMS
jgi:mannose-6-phosphate isomerase